MALKRNCAKNPAAPKPAAKITAAIRCEVTELSVAAGPIPGNGPPGSTSMSGLPRTAHSANTENANTDAAAIAPAEAGARQAMNRVAATSSVKTVRALSAWPLFSTIRVAPNR